MISFLEIVQQRRSLRAYLDKPVEPAKLEYMLECARLAPSWKNLQCWRFVVVTDRETRQALTASMQDSNPGRKALLEAPAVIVLCALPTASEVWEGKDFMMLDAGLAMEHLILAATEQGLGTCWQGMFREQVVRRVLGIPEDIRVVAMTPVGYPAQLRNPRPRKSMTEIVFEGRWSEE